MNENSALTHSLEDYIEAIYNTIAEKQVARSKDVKQRLKVNGASVTGALRNLAEKGMINYEPYEVITLTPKGFKVAQIIVRRHEILKDFNYHILITRTFLVFILVFKGPLF